jgi:hypothetical protein
MTPSGTTARRVLSRYTPLLDLRFPALQTRLERPGASPYQACVLTFAPLRLCVRFFLSGSFRPVRRLAQPEQHLTGFRH